jgi:hypothetical protein
MSLLRVSHGYNLNKGVLAKENEEYSTSPSITNQNISGEGLEPSSLLPHVMLLFHFLNSVLLLPS